MTSLTMLFCTPKPIRVFWTTSIWHILQGCPIHLTGLLIQWTMKERRAKPLFVFFFFLFSLSLFFGGWWLMERPFIKPLFLGWDSLWQRSPTLTKIFLSFYSLNTLKHCYSSWRDRIIFLTIWFGFIWSWSIRLFVLTQFKPTCIELYSWFDCFKFDIGDSSFKNTSPKPSAVSWLLPRRREKYSCLRVHA